MFLSLASIAKPKHLLQEVFQILPVYLPPLSWEPSANPALTLSYLSAMWMLSC